MGGKDSNSKVLGAALRLAWEEWASSAPAVHHQGQGQPHSPWVHVALGPIPTTGHSAI